MVIFLIIAVVIFIIAAFLFSVQFRPVRVWKEIGPAYDYNMNGEKVKFLRFALYTIHPGSSTRVTVRSWEFGSGDLKSYDLFKLMSLAMSFDHVCRKEFPEMY